MIETRGIYDDNAMVLEARKSIAWVDNHRFEIGSAGGQLMSNFHPVFPEEGVYELSPSRVRLEMQGDLKSHCSLSFFQHPLHP